MNRLYGFLARLQDIGGASGSGEAASDAAQNGGGGFFSLEGLMGFAPIILIIVVFYLLVFRPQSKKQKEMQKMIENIKKNDKVTTIGGIKGTIVNIKDDTVVLKVDDSTKLEFLKSAVSSVGAKGESGSGEKAGS